ncbi:MAG: plastocyanin/azurin family copper-binding protein [Pseudonocardiaceae bacterium]
MNGPVFTSPVMRALAAGLLLTLGACGEAVAGVGDETVTLTIRHSRFSSSAVKVSPGTVRFVVRNLDPIAHELIIGDGAAQLRHERGTESHHGDRSGEISVNPGATAETTYLVTAGNAPLLFGCHLPGHWDYGMAGTITLA